MSRSLRRQRRGLCAIGALLITLVSSASAWPGGRVDASWSAPVVQFIERSENCLHFAGEFGGDGSPRDAEVNQEMDKLRCDSLPADLRTLREHYRGDARVTARLKAFGDDGLPKDDGSDN